MGTIFPDKDFVSGNWKPLTSVIDSYPEKVPSVQVLGFDAVKNYICGYRGYRLCSVDAVVADRSGHFYFIEFKDTEKNPIAQLRKKAFDSLLLFWIAIGQSLSMEEIRGRSSFWYVMPDDSRIPESDRLGVLFESDGGVHVPAPQPYQLDFIGTSELYAEVKTLRTSQFRAALEDVNLVRTLDELVDCSRRSEPKARQRMVTCVDAEDFKKCVEPLVSLRMDIPFVELTNKRDRLLLYDGYDSSSETVTLRHLWKEPYPRMILATKTFDTAIIWAAAVHADKSLSELGGLLNGKVAFVDVPPSVVRPSNTSDFVLDFFDTCSSYFDKKNGLQLYEDNNLYRRFSIE